MNLLSLATIEDDDMQSTDSHDVHEPISRSPSPPPQEPLCESINISVRPIDFHHCLAVLSQAKIVKEVLWVPESGMNVVNGTACGLIVINKNSLLKALNVFIEFNVQVEHYSEGRRY